MRRMTVRLLGFTIFEMTDDPPAEPPEKPTLEGGVGLGGMHEPTSVEDEGIGFRRTGEEPS